MHLKPQATVSTCHFLPDVFSIHTTADAACVKGSLLFCLAVLFLMLSIARIRVKGDRCDNAAVGM